MGCHSTQTQILRSVCGHQSSPYSLPGNDDNRQSNNERIVPSNLDPRAFQGAVVCVIHSGSPVYFTGSTADGRWRQVKGALDGDKGSAIIHLPREHPNMYLTNIRGSDALLRDGGPLTAFAIFDQGSINATPSRNGETKVIVPHTTNTWRRLIP